MNTLRYDDILKVLLKAWAGFLLAAVTLFCSAGCSDKQHANAEDFGWFSYAPPEGWARLDMSQDATSIGFLPHRVIRETGVFGIEIRQVDWLKNVKPGELSDTVIADYRMHWEHDCEQAEQQGQPQPPFECNEIPALIDVPGQVEAYSILLIRNGKTLRLLNHYIEMPDGRRFIVEYKGSDPGYSEHLVAVTKSLDSLRFADTEVSD